MRQIICYKKEHAHLLERNQVLIKFLNCLVFWSVLGCCDYNDKLSFQIGSKNVAVKEMQTYAILDFAIPGAHGFPLNAMYGKPANRNEEGMNRSEIRMHNCLLLCCLLLSCGCVVFKLRGIRIHGVAVNKHLSQFCWCCFMQSWFLGNAKCLIFYFIYFNWFNIVF